MSNSVFTLAIGFLAQAFFSARILVQWILSERARRVLSPTVFWVLSLMGAYLLCIYGWLRDDFAIILGQFVSYYIYLWNLKMKGVWLHLARFLRFILLFTPLVAIGFLNVLENCRHHPVRHLVYASSSSVYGMGSQVPYTETDKTDKPVSLYAATKKSDELMAYSYSKLYGIPATGLRFFTVYGPWGRPDMAPFIFLKSILEGRPIHVFNHGNMERDFTYIDDVVAGIQLLLGHPPVEAVPHRTYNVGHSAPVALMDFIKTIEAETGCKAVVEMEDMQPGDVSRTYADISRLRHDFGFFPRVSVSQGIHSFYGWYRSYVERRPGFQAAL